MTERVVVMYDDVLSPSGRGKAKGKGKEKAKEKSKGKGKGKQRYDDDEDDDYDDDYGGGLASFRSQAELPTYCHQCRRATQHDKMRCTVIRENGVPCGKRYCDHCVDLRYVSPLCFSSPLFLSFAHMLTHYSPIRA